MNDRSQHRPTDEVPFVGRSFYGELGIVLKLAPKTNRPQWPSSATVEREWLQAIKCTHPLCVAADETEATLDLVGTAESFQARRFRVVMEAGLTLLDPFLGDQYRETLVGATNGHASWLKSDTRQPYTVSPLPDWVCIISQVLLNQAVYSRGEHATTLEAMGCTDTSLLPDYIPGERLEPADRVFEVGALVAQVLEEHGTVFIDLRMWLRQNPGGLQWTWRRRHWKSQSMTTIGKARTLSSRDRARAPGTDATRAHGELVLALDYWMAADDVERRRLVFHELCHFIVEGDQLKVRGHAVEAFSEEIDAFGVTTEGQAMLVAAAIQHADSADRLESFGVLPDDQLVLFRDLVEGAVGLDEAI